MRQAPDPSRDSNFSGKYLNFSYHNFYPETIASCGNYFATLPSKQLESTASVKCFEFLQESLYVFIFPKWLLDDYKEQSFPHPRHYLH